LQLIYYSLARSEDGGHDKQWIESVRSLRRYNPRQPVWLFVFNGLSYELAREADAREVSVIDMGSYHDWMQAWHPHGLVFARYPVLHKFLVLGEVSAPQLTQALFLDCDTYFFDDPARLFVPPNQCDWCAREEIGTRLHADGLDPANVDERRVGEIYASQRLNWVAPFNSGICLLNNGVWNSFAQLRPTFLDTVWRLLVGRELWSPDTGDYDGLRAAVMSQARERDFVRALPYPSENHWILEEIATWITLGHMPDLVQHVFTRQAVAQGSECIDDLRRGARPLAAHYFSSLEDDFFQALAETPAEGLR
jgi:hypothetical protein